jgi:hypothetical protein
MQDVVLILVRTCVVGFYGARDKPADATSIADVLIQRCYHAKVEALRHPLPHSSLFDLIHLWPEWRQLLVES